jgi:hypothetical protein
MSTMHRAEPHRAQHRAAPPPRPAHIVWHRFSAVFVPALLALILLAIGAATGAVPVALAIEGRQTLKITAKSYSADLGSTFPAFFQNPSGGRNTVIVLSLGDLRVQGLCVSTKVNTPAGPYVLRITSPDVGEPIRAGDVTLAIEDIDALDLKSRLLNANKGPKTHDTSLAKVGVGPAVPVLFDQLNVDVDVTIRWVTANQLSLSGLTLAGNLAQRECS